MIALKRYQQRALDALQKYFALARVTDPAAAFDRIVTDHPTDRHAPQRYLSRWGLTDVPFVCLRVPTGGGKTLMAAHAVSLAAAHYMERDRPVVLWLAPTTTILRQTADALKNPRHPYREALSAAFGIDGVAIAEIDAVANLRPKDLLDKCCIVLATYQALRVSEKNKEFRKVYGDNENFEEHFKRLPNVAPGLDRVDDSPGARVRYSFVNLLHQLRPLVILDEAHKAVSELSGEVIRRVNPSCVVEMTATPVDGNILHRVYASDLKAEEMAKLPFLLTVHGDWEQAVAGAVAARRRLADLAAADADDYLRPIALFQAEKKNGEATVEVLRQHLIEHEKIPESEIVVATGDQRGLDGIDLFDRACPITHVITVEALKEGWDCSFAYVFCSVAQVRSPVDVEQLLGRVMRMPYARKRRQDDLNRAYAHVVSDSFAAAADEMYRHLINMGFSADEVESNLQTPPPSLFPEYEGPGSLFGGPPPLVVAATRPPDLAALTGPERDLVDVAPRAGGGVTVTCRGDVSAAAEAALAAVAKDPDELARALFLRRRQTPAPARPATPSEKGVEFGVGQLKLFFDGYPEDPEPQLILHAMHWEPLQQAEHGLTPDEFRYDESAKTFEFDLQGERMRYRNVDDAVQLSLFSPDGWDETALARWLDNHCRRDDIRQVDLLEFCRRTIVGLLRVGAFTLKTLTRAKFALAAAISGKLDQLRATALAEGYQTLLFGPDRLTRVVFDDPHRFPREGYAENVARYTGAYTFQRHFHPVIRDLKSAGEEFDCARLIDAHPAVDYWVRNVDRQDGSFRMPLAGGHYFYPDFVVRLKDGRTLVVEYKGAHLKDSPDSLEKQNIGALWADESGGRNLFLMAVDKHNGRDLARQLDDILR